MAGSGRGMVPYLLLGFDYVARKVGIQEDVSLFEQFDFWDCYRYGATLVCSVQKKIKKSIANSTFKNDRAFLGPYWSNFLGSSLGPPSQGLVDMDAYGQWSRQAETFIGTVPFADKLARSFTNLKGSGSLSDDFYLNYNIDDIDFESLVLSAFANTVVGTVSSHKMGLTLAEFKQFSSVVVGGDNRAHIVDFIKSFGLDTVPGFDGYLDGLIKEHLGGYEYEKMKDDEYRYVGGPIILNI